MNTSDNERLITSLETVENALTDIIEFLRDRRLELEAAPMPETDPSRRERVRAWLRKRGGAGE